MPRACKPMHFMPSLNAYDCAAATSEACRCAIYLDLFVSTPSFVGSPPRSSQVKVALLAVALSDFWAECPQKAGAFFRPGLLENPPKAGLELSPPRRSARHFARVEQPRIVKEGQVKMARSQIIECVDKSSQGHGQFAFGFFLALPFHRRRSHRYPQNSQQTKGGCRPSVYCPPLPPFRPTRLLKPYAEFSLLASDRHSVPFVAQLPHREFPG
jgi:hypothetical protein